MEHFIVVLAICFERWFWQCLWRHTRLHVSAKRKDLIVTHATYLTENLETVLDEILWRLLINAAGQDCILATEKMTVNPKFFQNDRPRVNNVVCEPFFLSLTRIREGVVNAKFSSTFQHKCPNYFTNFFQSIIFGQNCNFWPFSIISTHEFFHFFQRFARIVAKSKLWAKRVLWAKNEIN